MLDASEVPICRADAPNDEDDTVEKEACNSFQRYFMDYYPEATLFPNLKGTDCPTGKHSRDCRYKPARKHLEGSARSNAYVGQPAGNGDRISKLGGSNGKNIDAKIEGGDIGDWDHTSA